MGRARRARRARHAHASARGARSRSEPVRSSTSWCARGRLPLPTGGIERPAAAGPGAAGRRPAAHARSASSARFARRGRKVLPPPRIVVSDPLGPRVRPRGAAPASRRGARPAAPRAGRHAPGDGGDGTGRCGARGRPSIAAEVDLDGLRPDRARARRRRASSGRRWPRGGELHGAPAALPTATRARSSSSIRAAARARRTSTRPCAPRRRCACTWPARAAARCCCPATGARPCSSRRSSAGRTCTCASRWSTAARRRPVGPASAGPPLAPIIYVGARGGPEPRRRRGRYPIVPGGDGRVLVVPAPSAGRRRARSSPSPAAPAMSSVGRRAAGGGRMTAVRGARPRAPLAVAQRAAARSQPDACGSAPSPRSGSSAACTGPGSSGPARAATCSACPCWPSPPACRRGGARGAHRARAARRSAAGVVPRRRSSLDLLVAGVPLWSAADRWDDAERRTSRNAIATLPDQRCPTAGSTTWVRTVLIAGGACCCWPRRSSRSAPRPQTRAATICLGACSTSCRSSSTVRSIPTSTASLFALLLGAMLWGRAARRPRGARGGRARRSSPSSARRSLAPHLDTPRPWVDYEALAEALAARQDQHLLLEPQLRAAGLVARRPEIAARHARGNRLLEGGQPRRLRRREWRQDRACSRRRGHAVRATSTEVGRRRSTSPSRASSRQFLVAGDHDARRPLPHGRRAGDAGAPS